MASREALYHLACEVRRGLSLLDGSLTQQLGWQLVYQI
jgi:hypothetical protein